VLLKLRQESGGEASANRGHMPLLGDSQDSPLQSTVRVERRASFLSVEKGPFSGKGGPASVSARPCQRFMNSRDSENGKTPAHQACYRILVKRFHPDLFPTKSATEFEAEVRIRQINAAYAVL